MKTGVNFPDQVSLRRERLEEEFERILIQLIDLLEKYPEEDRSQPSFQERVLFVRMLVPSKGQEKWGQAPHPSLVQRRLVQLCSSLTELPRRSK
jgi:hypothetical protein